MCSNVVFANGIWKSGNNLLIKILSLMGYDYSGFGLAASSLNGDYRVVRNIIRRPLFENYPINVGLEMSAEVRRKWLEYKISNIKSRSFSGHASYSLALMDVLAKKNVTSIQIIRDPRDVLISFCHWVITRPDYYPYVVFSELSFEKRFEFLVKGVSQNSIFLEPFRTVLDRSIGWLKDERVVVVKFEDLVNKGDVTKKHKEYMKIANAVKFKGDISEVIKASFGGTHTFRKGEAGNWEKEFTPVMHDIFNKHLGDKLSEWGY